VLGEFDVEVALGVAQIFGLLGGFLQRSHQLSVLLLHRRELCAGPTKRDVSFAGLKGQT
jgi:hypothetical protein